MIVRDFHLCHEIQHIIDELLDVYFERTTGEFSSDAVARSTAAKLKLESYYKGMIASAIERNARYGNELLSSLMTDQWHSRPKADRDGDKSLPVTYLRRQGVRDTQVQQHRISTSMAKKDEDQID
jgi:hypothetical protein